MKEKKKNDNIDEQIDKISKEIYTYSHLLVSLSLQISLSLSLSVFFSLTHCLSLSVSPFFHLSLSPLSLSLSRFASLSHSLSLPPSFFLSLTHIHTIQLTWFLIVWCVVEVEWRGTQCYLSLINTKNIWKNEYSGGR